MIDISSWIKDFLTALDTAFADRVFFIGLQGSYARGEATENSDIDVVVILDELNAEDIQKYNEMLDTLQKRELVCGFLSGRRELISWEPSDLFQFYYDTKPLRGSLDALLTLLDTDAVKRAVKIGACNVYHGCVHNMLYEKSEEILRGLYKSASFSVQAVAFLQSGKYIKGQSELLGCVSGNDRKIIQTFLNLKNGGAAEFDTMSETLLAWAKERICVL